MSTESCRAWTQGDPELVAYHDHEWCKPRHDDTFEFEMLCLEGASVGLSWAQILHRRDAYRRAFHDFDIDACASMTDAELDALADDAGIVRNRRKIASVRTNARAVLRIRDEFGSFDAYLWGFVDGEPVVGNWATLDEMPASSEVSRRMSADLKRRGFSFVGPVITYSFLQAIGIVNDHLRDCACK
jgi:DNA-3-methyladenine glycosylase I